MREPTRRPPPQLPGWNDRIAVALLVVVAGHLRTVEPGPLTPDRLASFVAGRDLPALVAALADSPSGPVRHGTHHLRALLRAGQAHAYARVLPGLIDALADPFFRLALTKEAATADLDLFPVPPDAPPAASRAPQPALLGSRPCATRATRPSAWAGGRPRRHGMTDAQARARVWTRCLAALVLAALTGPLVVVLTPLAHASSTALHVVVTVLAAVLVGASVALTVLLIVAVRRVVRPRLDGHR